MNEGEKSRQFVKNFDWLVAKTNKQTNKKQDLFVFDPRLAINTFSLSGLNGVPKI